MKKFYIITLIFLYGLISYSAQDANVQPQQTPAAGQGSQGTGTQTQPAAAAQGQATPQQTEREVPTVIPSDPSTLQREYYRSIEINTDYTVKLVGKIEENQILSARNFLLVTYQSTNKIKSIANYGNDRKLTLYLLNERLNMFFYYLTFEYSDDLVKLISLRDPSDQKLWELRFEYDDRKNITKGEIWRRETVSGELKLLFYNDYKYYSQGKMFLHSVYNEKKELEEKTYYTPEGVKKRFERYRDGGNRVQYYVLHFYQNNNEVRREVYSASDVLLEIVEVEQPAATNRQQQGQTG